jgi:hypothetical protein
MIAGKGDAFNQECWSDNNNNTNGDLIVAVA